MRISGEVQTTFLDYPDNDSLAVIVYMVGCSHACRGCHNVNLQEIDGVPEISVDDLREKVMTACLKHRTNKVVLSGGDPLYPGNIDGTIMFLSTVSNKLDVCIYTGYDITYVEYHGVHGFKFVKCGRYNEDGGRLTAKDDEKIVFASIGQELYDHNFHKISSGGIYFFKGFKGGDIV